MPFKFIINLLRSIFKFISAIIGICLGVLVIAIIFLDDLPLGAPQQRITSPQGGPYADMHVHIAGVGAGESSCFISKKLKESFKYDFYLKALGVTEDEILVNGDSLVIKRLSEKIASAKHVDRAVVLALDGIVKQDGELDQDLTQVYVPNDYVAKEVAKYENLLFGASINPYRPDAMTRLVRAKKQGAVLVKWIPSLMHIDPADKELIPFYLALLELDLPLLSHAGDERSFLGVRDELSDPKRLELPLKLGVTVIAAHIGTTGENQGETNFERLLPLFQQYPNLYADISSLTQVNRLGYLKRALKFGSLSERLVYGSDWPLQFRLLVSPWYHILSVRAADIRYLFRIENEFDRDILLKKAMGVPEHVFTRGETLLKLKKLAASNPDAASSATSAQGSEPEASSAKLSSKQDK